MSANQPNNIVITTREEYEHLVGRGYEPLMGVIPSLMAIITMPNVLRREIQKEKFKTIEQFYRYCFEHSGRCCEETGETILEYSAINISHILTRGAHPAISTDPRNFNFLTLKSHMKWETGDRKSMKIYQKNQELSQRLKLEYYGETRR